MKKNHSEIKKEELDRCNRFIEAYRLANYAVESSRYVDYSDELLVIEPYWKENYDNGIYEIWKKYMQYCENTYKFLRNNVKLSPQAVRGILSLDTKVEINIKTNLREWRHIFKLRGSKAAHPDMRRIMMPLLEDLNNRLPEIFNDIYIQFKLGE